MLYSTKSYQNAGQLCVKVTIDFVKANKPIKEIISGKSTAYCGLA
jgi:hypothetical protein